MNVNERSLWDPLCKDQDFYLLLNEYQKQEVVIPSEEIILENEFTQYN